MEINRTNPLQTQCRLLANPKLRTYKLLNIAPRDTCFYCFNTYIVLQYIQKIFTLKHFVLACWSSHLEGYQMGFWQSEQPSHLAALCCWQHSFIPKEENGPNFCLLQPDRAMGRTPLFLNKNDYWRITLALQGQNALLRADLEIQGERE